MQGWIDLFIDKGETSGYTYNVHESLQESRTPRNCIIGVAKLDSSMFDMKYKHQILQDLLKKEILSGKYQSGDRFPSESEMCVAYGVSNNTIREAISSLVNEGLLIRKHGKGTFVTDWQQNINKQFAIIVPHIFDQDSPHFKYHDSYLGPVLSIINCGALNAGYASVLYLTDAKPENERQCLLDALKRKLDGVVMFTCDTVANVDVFNQLLDNNIPIVLMDRYFKEVPTHYVGPDNKTSVSMAIDYLVQHGAKDIYCLTRCSEVSSITEKEERFREIFTMRGIDPDTRIIKWTDTNRHINYTLDAYNASMELLKKTPKGTGFLAFQVQFAVGLLKAMQDSGLNPLDYYIACSGKVPKDLINCECNMVQIDYQPELIGKELLATLLGAFENHSSPVHRLTECKLVEFDPQETGWSIFN